MQQQIVCKAPRPQATGARRSGAGRKWSAADSVVRRLLGQSLAVRDQVLSSVLAVCPNLVEDDQLVAQNLQLLRSLSPTAQHMKRLVVITPRLLAVPLASWQEFLAAYGLHSNQIWQLLTTQPQLLLQGNIFGAGRAMLFLKQLGWTDLEVTLLVIQHPQNAAILLMDLESQLQPVLQHLMYDLGMTQEAAAAFLKTHPAVLYSSNYQKEARKLIRKQQLQELYLV